MKNLRIQVGLAFALVVALCSSGRVEPVAAAELGKPVAVVSIASFDRLMKDMNYLTKASGRSDVGQMLQFMAFSFAQDLDRDRPAGVLVSLGEGQPAGVGFVPIPDLDKFLKSMEEKFSAGVEDLGNGVKKLEIGQGAYIRYRDGWLFFTDDPANLKQLPDDPVAALDGLNKEYSIAMRFYIQNIPIELRQMAIDQIESGIELGMQPGALGDDVENEVAERLTQSSLQSISMLINDSETVTVGWAVDPDQSRTYLDLSAKAVDGSTLAGQFNQLADIRSSFTGFLMPEAAAVLHGTTRISEDESEQVVAMVDFLRRQAVEGIEKDPNAPEALKEIANRVLDVLSQTAKEGKADLGAAVVLAPKSFRFVGGVQVADGEALASAFQQLIELAGSAPDVPRVQFHADKHHGVDLHTFQVPIPEREDEARMILGDQLDVVVGTGPKSLYIAFGEDPSDLLKKVIDRSAEQGEQRVPITQFRLAMKPLIRFLASVKQDDKKLSAMAEVAEQVDGHDAIALRVDAIENGVTYRIVMEEGVLKMIGLIAEKAQGRR